MGKKGGCTTDHGAREGKEKQVVHHGDVEVDGAVRSTIGKGFTFVGIADSIDTTETTIFWAVASCFISFTNSITTLGHTWRTSTAISWAGHAVLCRVIALAVTTSRAGTKTGPRGFLMRNSRQRHGAVQR